jgi:hypothetical protein
VSDDIPQDEPLFALREANSLEKFDQRMADLIEFASTVYISSEVRDECVAELEAAKKNGYKIPFGFRLVNTLAEEKPSKVLKDSTP